MKKFFSVFLSVVLLLSALTLSGCGGKEAKEAKEPTAVSSENTAKSSIKLPDALSNIEALTVPQISDTVWQLSGGIFDGVEMEQEDLDALIEQCGGIIKFSFSDTNELKMTYGKMKFDGNYEVINDGLAIHANLAERYEYYGVFADVEGDTILILSEVKEPQSALYLTKIEG